MESSFFESTCDRHKLTYLQTKKVAEHEGSTTQPRRTTVSPEGPLSPVVLLHPTHGQYAASPVKRLICYLQRV